jgi:hypothetical protein
VLDSQREGAGPRPTVHYPLLAKGGELMRKFTIVGYYTDAEPGDPVGHYIGAMEASDPEAAIRGAYLETDGAPLAVICAIDEAGNIYEPPLG